MPRLLPPTALVVLLKDPLCVVQALRVVLGAVGAHYGRTFTDQCDFVRFAGEERLALDLRNPWREQVLPQADKP